MSVNGFTHLHLHSQYSLLDGAITFDRLLKRCKKLEMDSVAVTDHGNLFGVIEFYTKARHAHVKPIIGIGAYVAPADRRAAGLHRSDRGADPFERRHASGSGGDHRAGCSKPCRDGIGH